MMWVSLPGPGSSGLDALTGDLEPQASEYVSLPLWASAFPPEDKWLYSPSWNSREDFCQFQ